MRLEDGINTCNLLQIQVSFLIKLKNMDQTSSTHLRISTVLPVKSDSDVMFCLLSYQGIMIV